MCRDTSTIYRDIVSSRIGARDQGKVRVDSGKSAPAAPYSRRTARWEQPVWPGNSWRTAAWDRGPLRRSKFADAGGSSARPGPSNAAGHFELRRRCHLGARSSRRVVLAFAIAGATIVVVIGTGTGTGTVVVVVVVVVVSVIVIVGIGIGIGTGTGTGTGTGIGIGIGIYAS